MRLFVILILVIFIVGCGSEEVVYTPGANCYDQIGDVNGDGVIDSNDCLGQNGIDGKDGVDGADARDGVDGRDGIDAEDGVDGREQSNITPEELYLDDHDYLRVHLPGYMQR